MAGLLNAQQSTQKPEPQGKNEEAYRRLGLAAMKTLYTKPESDHVIEILRAGNDRPAEAVAQAAFSIIKRMQNEIKGLDPSLAFSVAPPLVALIFEMGMKSGAFTEETFPKDTDPQKLIGEALSVLAKLEGGTQGAQPQGNQTMPPQPQTMGA